MATLLFAMMIQAWLSCLHSPQHPSPNLVSNAPSPSFISPLDSGSFCAPQTPPARAGQFRFFDCKEQKTNSNLLKTKINLLGNSWEAFRTKESARYSGLWKVLAWKLAAPSELVTLHLGQSLKHPNLGLPISGLTLLREKLAAGAQIRCTPTLGLVSPSFRGSNRVDSA